MIDVGVIQREVDVEPKRGKRPFDPARGEVREADLLHLPIHHVEIPAKHRMLDRTEEPNLAGRASGQVDRQVRLDPTFQVELIEQSSHPEFLRLARERTVREEAGRRVFPDPQAVDAERIPIERQRRAESLDQVSANHARPRMKTRAQPHVRPQGVGAGGKVPAKPRGRQPLDEAGKRITREIEPRV